MLTLRNCGHRELERIYSLLELDFDKKELLPRLGIHKAMLKGDVELAGVGNGDPMDYDSLQGDSIRAFHGLAQAILRGKAGELRVSSPGLGIKHRKVLE